MELPSTPSGRLCPKGIFVRPRMDHYREESRHIMALIAQTAGPGNLVSRPLRLLSLAVSNLREPDEQQLVLLCTGPF